MPDEKDDLDKSGFDMPGIWGKLQSFSAAIVMTGLFVAQYFQNSQQTREYRELILAEIRRNEEQHNKHEASLRELIKELQKNGRPLIFAKPDGMD